MVNPTKIGLVWDCLMPTSATKVMNFIGIRDYNKWFSLDFFTINAPLTKFTQKSFDFQWSNEYEEILKRLNIC